MSCSLSRFQTTRRRRADAGSTTPTRCRDVEMPATGGGREVAAKMYRRFALGHLEPTAASFAADDLRRIFTPMPRPSSAPDDDAAARDIVRGYFSALAAASRFDFDTRYRRIAHGRAISIAEYLGGRAGRRHFSRRSPISLKAAHDARSCQAPICRTRPTMLQLLRYAGERRSGIRFPLLAMTDDSRLLYYT